MTAYPPASEPSDEPPHGYQVPPGFGAPPPPDGGASAYDPLVPPPFGGLSPLWERLTDNLRRTGRPVMLILLLTFALPQIAQSFLLESAFEGVTAAGGFVLPGADEVGAEGAAALSFTLVAWSVAMFVAIALIASIGWGGAIWAVTQGAAGLPVTVAEALRAGARRMLPMFGWYLAYALLVVVGVILCVLPGIYVAIAGALFSYVVIYEAGRNPIGRSFSLVNKAFGAALGRLLLLALFMITVFCVVGFCVGGVVGVADPGAGAFARLSSDAVMSLLLVPVYAVLLVGALLTYTQVRAREEPVSTAALWAAANQGPTDAPPGFYGPVQPG